MSAKATRNIPAVFISSTAEDLRPYRAAARFELERAGFHVLMQEYFVASGEKPPLQKCLAEVSKADVLIVIVAHRYGWVPPGQPGTGAKSITWLECEEAHQGRKEILAYLVDEKDPWPEELKEEYRLTGALREGKATPELLAEIQRNVAKLKEFKQWLSGLGIRATFSSPDSLRAEVVAALREWVKRHPESAESLGPHGRDDPRAYLRALREQTAWIDIRGLHARTGKALQPFPIEDLYIPLTTAGHAVEAGGDGVPARSKGEAFAEGGNRERLQLEDILSRRRLVLAGDPGSGKSTFLKRVAFELSQAWLDQEAGPPASLPATGSEAGAELEPRRTFRKRLAAAFRRAMARKEIESVEVGQDASRWPFPFLIRIADLAEHMGARRQRSEGPTTAENPEWLIDFLKTQSQGLNWQLDEVFFRRQLDSGGAILLFDGLDEATAGVERDSMARLFENATRAYQRCRFVVTTRPLAYAGEATLAGFHLARIEPLDEQAIEQFLSYWCGALYAEVPGELERHRDELRQALRGSREIGRMATNPVMLTALAVVHWNEGRLPEQRWELYESTLNWLAWARVKKPERETPERCRALFEHLALAMQNHPDGRQVQVSKGWARDALAPQFIEVSEPQRLARSLAFLDQEEEDSGIIVSRGGEIRFWHLTFQEFQAARAIAGLADSGQYKLLLDESKIYRPEWREVALLLAGVLMGQGKAKVDGLISEMLNRLAADASLAKRAKCVGLLGAMVRDLRPLGYEPADPRYKKTLDAVLGIFDKEKSRQVEFQVRLEAAEALGQAGDPRLQRDNWITIKAGAFWMGGQKEDPSKPNYDPEAKDNESPVHEVYLEEYQIGRYPVTVEEYQRFMADEGYSNERWWKAGGFGESKAPPDWDEQVLHPNRPVVNVSWYEAMAYCVWKGVRLPTEAEWERAARGRQGRKYPWGNEEPDTERANYDAGKVGHATPAGLYPRGATPEGIEDLAGNVWEWVADWYGGDYYGKADRENPNGPASGQSGVLRGGSWLIDPRGLRAAIRDGYGPEGRGGNLGFRCVREVFA